MERFLIAHPEIIPYIEQFQFVPDFDENKTKENLSIFRKSRMSHNRDNLKKLKNFLKEAEKLVNNSKSKLEKLSQKSCEVIPNCLFDDQITNSKIREISFSCNFLYEIRIQIYSVKIAILTRKMKIAQTLLEFFESDIITEENFFVMNDKYFNFNSMKSDNAHLKKLIFRKKCLKNHIKINKNKIDNKQLPLWFNNFDKFFSEIVAEAYKVTDKQLSYFLPMDKEVSISRAIFRCGSIMSRKNNHKNNSNDNLKNSLKLVKIKEKIDNCLLNNINNSPKILSNEILKLSLQLIPKSLFEHHDSKTRAIEESISLLIFFRIIFDRCYELYYSTIYDIEELDSEKEYQKKIINLTTRNIADFSMPAFLSEDIKNCSTENEMSISHFFYTDKLYSASSELINETIFMTNPIDMIYFIHKALLIIHKASFMYKVDHHLTSLDDWDKLLCFDDLFSIFVGVFLASYIPSFNQFSKFILNYTPEDSLSDSFDYAESSIKALTVYFHGL